MLLSFLILLFFILSDRQDKYPISESFDDTREKKLIQVELKLITERINYCDPIKITICFGLFLFLGYLLTPYISMYADWCFNMATAIASKYGE